MNEDLKQNRIENFLRDEVTSRMVFEAVRDSFLENKGQRDVQLLAAERLAVDLLSKAWRDLSKYKTNDEEKTSQLRQVGL